MRLSNYENMVDFYTALWFNYLRIRGIGGLEEVANVMKGGIKMPNLTPFGKAVRKLRLDRDEILKDMAEKLDVSPSFLSAVETGKKKIPDEMLQELATHYQLKKNGLADLRRLAQESQQQFKLNVSKTKKETRGLVAAFARKFTELDQKQIDKILRVLNKGD